MMNNQKIIICLIIIINFFSGCKDDPWAGENLVFENGIKAFKMYSLDNKIKLIDYRNYDRIPFEGTLYAKRGMGIENLNGEIVFEVGMRESISLDKEKWHTFPLNEEVITQLFGEPVRREKVPGTP